MRAAEQSIPIKRRRTKKTVSYWNDNCNQAIQDKRKAQRRMERSKDLGDCIQYRKKAAAQRTIKQSQKEYWQSFCETINTNTKTSTVWRMTKTMAGTKAMREIPVIKEGHCTLISNTEKAEAFANSFARDSSSENYEKAFLDQRDWIKWAKKTPSPKNELHPVNDPISMFELDDAIRQSKTNTSPGEDRVCYEMLKQLPRATKGIILDHINRIWREGIIPANWKHSIVIPIHKPGKDANQVNSYRPISLTDALCKVNERVVANRLNWFMEANKLYNTHQAGFRKNRSCLDQIMRLQSEAENAINSKKFTVGIFLDFTKAYDMIWIEGLMLKILKLGIGGNMYRWINNFLTIRTIQVRVGNSLSGLKRMENGTPQESAISPILFLLMINDMPKPSEGVSNAIFADDTALWKTGSDLETIIRQMQANLTKVRKWCTSWGFKLSKDKTVAVIFTHRLVTDPTRLRSTESGSNGRMKHVSSVSYSTTG